jgi:hypothetical protein
MGDQYKREELAAEIIGVSSQTIKDVFATTSGKAYVVYLLLIGKAQTLFPDSNYTEDDLVCKYGCTNDMKRRTNENERYFNTAFKTKIRCLTFAIVESLNKTVAESCVSDQLMQYKLANEMSQELVVIKESSLKTIRSLYGMVQNTYIGCHEDMNLQITELKEQIKDKDNQILLNAVNHKIELNEEKHKNELKDHLNEKLTMQMKMDNLQYQLTLNQKDFELQFRTSSS